MNPGIRARSGPRTLLACAGLVALSLAPSSRGLWAQRPEDFWKEGIDAAEEIRSEFERYRGQARKLRGYHDTGRLDERSVLRVLNSAGVFASADREGRFGAGFRPFRVRVYKGMWRWPLRAGVVSSEYGRRWGRRHDGVDIAADPGVPVLASASGTVLYAGDGLRGYGHVVILRHDQKTVSLYAHNRVLAVKQGQQVQAGQRVAVLGSTGHSTGPHVHFEIRVRGRPVNPRDMLVQGRF